MYRFEVNSNCSATLQMITDCSLAKLYVAALDEHYIEFLMCLLPQSGMITGWFRLDQTQLAI